MSDEKAVSGAGPCRTKPSSAPGMGRLLRHADFERVYKDGRRHFSANMTVFYLPRVQPGDWRIGFTVSRALGGAVVRNRMRRRLREAVRLKRTAISGTVDVVINPKKSLLTADFQQLVNEVDRALEVIQKKLAESSRKGDGQSGIQI